MRKSILLTVAIFALTTAANAKSFSVKLFQPSVVGAAELQPGEYKLDLNESKVVIRNGKQSAEATVKVETVNEKYASTTVRYDIAEGKPRIQEIHLGGTKTKLVFN
jgi:hypothetical protein